MPALVLFVLDIETGRPAADIEVLLHRNGEGHRHETLYAGRTGPDGCVRTSVASPAVLIAENFRAEFNTGAYFRLRKKSPTFTSICVDFLWDGQEDMVLPLLISAHSYTTYRGS